MKRDRENLTDQYNEVKRFEQEIVTLKEKEKKLTAKITPKRVAIQEAGIKYFTAKKRKRIIDSLRKTSYPKENIAFLSEFLSDDKWIDNENPVTYETVIAFIEAEDFLSSNKENSLLKILGWIGGLIEEEDAPSVESCGNDDN